MDSHSLGSTPSQALGGFMEGRGQCGPEGPLIPTEPPGVGQILLGPLPALIFCGSLIRCLEANGTKGLGLRDGG